jgi:hypothetical protein
MRPLNVAFVASAVGSGSGVGSTESRAATAATGDCNALRFFDSTADVEGAADGGGAESQPASRATRSNAASGCECFIADVL